MKGLIATEHFLRIIFRAFLSPAGFLFLLSLKELVIVFGLTKLIGEMEPLNLVGKTGCLKRPDWFIIRVYEVVNLRDALTSPLIF